MISKSLAILLFGGALSSVATAATVPSNTTLIEPTTEKPSDETTLEFRASGNQCAPYGCPDHGNLEMWARKREPKPGNFVWDYFIRINDCNQCMTGGIDEGGCKEFRTCDRNQAVCIDWRNNRGHRIWKDNGHKTCYRVKSEYMCSGYAWAAWFDYEVACDW